MKQAEGKDSALEALRGLAAFTVVAWHCVLGFFPAYAGIFPGYDRLAGLNGTPFFFLMNGPAAVQFFFVLSGFVLTRRALRDADSGILLRGASKRIFRLAPPIFLAVIGSWALFACGLYRPDIVGPIVGSRWLTNFGDVVNGPLPFIFADALKQGIYGTLFRGHVAYDSSLWTMRIELIGSFIAFALAAALIYSGPRKLLVLLCFAAACFVSKQLPDSFHYYAFPAGVGLALLTIKTKPSFPLGVSCAGIGLACALFGFQDGRGFYGHLPGLIWHDWIMHTAAAFLLILCVEANGHIKQSLSGPLARWLGRLSFPVYLIHVLVLFSAGCATFLALREMWPRPYPALAATGVTVIVTLAVAIPFAMFDGWWTRKLGVWANRLIPRGERRG